MNSFRRLGTIALVTIALTITAFGQAQAGKVAVVDTRAFGAPNGITTYLAADKKLNAEFNTENSQLGTMKNQLQTMKTQLEALQKSSAPADLNKKVEEYNALVRQFKFKDEDAKSRFQTRQIELLGPVSADILKRLQEFTLKNNYSMILDAGKLESSGLILGFDRKFDVTAAFIQYYNALPAGTASTQ